MSGISSGMAGFNYSETFKTHSAEELKKQLSTGLNKEELQNAGFHALKDLARSFEEASDPIVLKKFKETAEKFSLVFPDKAKTIEAHFSNEFKHIRDLPLIDLSALSGADSILNFVASHMDEMNKDPTIATKAHHMLHDLAQHEIEKGDFKAAFEIASQAAASIPLSDRHPLHEMDKAILQGASEQYDVKTGAHFGSFDTSIVKGGNLHATQRVIDGRLTNSFDFKISHYARDELENYLNAIVSNLEEFKDSLPKGLCTDVKINEGERQQYLKFDEANNQFTRSGAYCPGGAAATEIVFEGAGKVIIGTHRYVGCMYNWIQVEMDANLPPGEGVKLLHQLLSVSGIGPVLGKQPADSDERMKIAQLYRAFFPSKATAFDTTKEFYKLPVDDLKKKIVEDEPEMAEIFTKYLDPKSNLMQKVQILPGKEIWGIMDLGQQIREKGGIGFMTGVSSVNWDATKSSIKRLLTQGAMSTEQRLQAGIFKEGASSEEDLCSGGGDQIFTRLITRDMQELPINSFEFFGHAQILWNLDTAAQRVPYGLEIDAYGVKNRFSNNYPTYLDRLSLMELAEYMLPYKAESNEVMFKNSLDPSHIAGVVVATSERKKDLIKYLVAEGLAEDRSGTVYLNANGKKVEEFIHVGEKFEEKMWG